jgi:hypothetical protein
LPPCPTDTTVITLADWYARPFSSYLSVTYLHDCRYHTVAPSAGLVPTADATLINGIGRYVGGPTVPLTVITVLPNKRYRFRLVSLSCDPFFNFSIDGHSFVRNFLIVNSTWSDATLYSRLSSRSTVSTLNPSSSILLKSMLARGIHSF